MNLRDIRTAIEDQIIYAPELEAYRHNVTRLVQRVYHQLVSTADWPWLLRTHTIRLLVDQTDEEWSYGGSGELNRSISMTTANFESLWSQILPDAETAGAGVEAAYSNLLLGHEVHFDDLMVGDEILGYREPYIIERVEGLGGVLNYNFFLDPRFPATNNKVDDETITIKFRRYRLPSDFRKMVSVVSRDDELGEISPVLRHREAQLLLLQDDDPGEPQWYLMESGYPYFPTNPGTFKGTVSGTDIASGPEGDWLQQRRNAPPRKTFTATGTTGGSLQNSQKYTYACAWVYAGRISPLGPEVSVTTSASQNQVDLSGLPVLDDQYGRDLQIYRRKGEGPWYYIGTTVGGDGSPDPTVSTFSDTLDDDDLEQSMHTLRRYDHVSRDGPYEYIRFYPRPTTAKNVELLYYARPGEMLDDYDEPDMPEEFHHLLVHLALVELGQRHEGEAFKRGHKAQADELLKLLKARYLAPGGVYQKGMIGQTRRRFFPIELPINYTGP